MRGLAGQLELMGLLNYSSPDFGTLAAARTSSTYLGYCSSNKCAGTALKNKKGVLIIETIVRSTNIKCPHCKKDLFFETKTNYLKE